MTIDDMVEGLRGRGCAIEGCQVNSGGRFVYVVQPWNVAMFHEDVADILVGRSTLAEVMSRNEDARADMANPWPVA